MKNGMNKAGRYIVYIALIILAVVFLFPFYWLVTSAFKSTAEILSRYMVWLPEKMQWKNFTNGWKAIPPLSYDLFFTNTFKIVFMNVLGYVLSSTLVGFGFSRLNFKGKNILFIIMLSTMMLPSQVTLIPVFLIWTRLNFINTYVPLIIPSFFGSAFFIFLLRQFMNGIPYELDEAAICDGCSKFGIYCRIILPLCKPAIFTIMVFSFTDAYEEFFNCLIYLNKPVLYTVSLALRMFINNEGPANWGPTLAMALVTMVPLILVFIIAQKTLIQGITTTGLKG